ncbi:MAG: quinolinate synthase NadA [Pseudomonadota bacterium]
MFKQFEQEEIRIPLSRVQLKPDLEICQGDYPLDWYQPEFAPYAEAYQALPDREPDTVIRWMKQYIEPAQNHFGDTLLLLAHYYMGGEIVNLIEQFGGQVGDSYQLALKAAFNPEKKIVVESAVHFMAESIAILANPDQRVYITNPKAGCTMEMNAKDDMVEPVLLALNERYGEDNILPICYMNTSGRIKALTGAQGGAVCTSSNVKAVFEWALTQNKKILFIPDQYMGENVAQWVGIKQDNIAYLPGGHEAAQFNIDALDTKAIKQFDQATLFLFGSHCAVHSFLRAPMVDYWRARDYTVIVHPECRHEVVSIADAAGSTAFIWDYILNDRGPRRHKKYAIGTENHMVKNVRMKLADKGYDIVHLGDALISDIKAMGCGCATMSRNDPPHLVALLDLLRQGKLMDYNLVKPGDVVNEFTGQRQRLDDKGQQWLCDQAKKALQRMIEITESKS